MKILITGTAGLLGANYSRHLIKSGHEVIGLDNLSGGFKAFIPKEENFKFYKVNIENIKKVKKIPDSLKKLKHERV